MCLMALLSRTLSAVPPLLAFGMLSVVCCSFFYLFLFNWVYRNGQKDEDRGIFGLFYTSGLNVSLYRCNRKTSTTTSTTTITPNHTGEREKKTIVNTNRAIDLYFGGCSQLWSKNSVTYFFFLCYDACCRSISLVVSCF